jgi:predicted ATPase
VLRNLNDRRDADKNRFSPESRYETILKWSRKAFPFFDSWGFQGVGSNVLGEAKLTTVTDLVPAHQLADGVIQFTILMAALYGDKAGSHIVLLDEPDLSLHPWALFVLAEAIEDATKNWGRQVMLATHSPVLLSQFPEESLFLMMPKDGATTIQRVSEMTENRGLLDQYAVGALYMSQLIGEQSKEPMVRLEPIHE